MPPEVNRQRGNEAFTEFLTLLKFPTSKDLALLFTGKICEPATHNDENRLDAVILDGTALGILEALLNFERITSIVPPVARVSTLQYIMKTTKHRQFADCVILTARKSLSSGWFQLKPTRKLAPKPQDMTKLFFEGTNST